MTINGLFDFLYVHRNYQRIGVASILQEEVEKEAWLQEEHEKKAIEEEKHEQNEKADIDSKNVHRAYEGMRVDPIAFEQDYKS